MLIDTHAHIDPRTAPAGRLLQEMTQASVERAILIEDVLDARFSQLSALTRQHRHRFALVAAIDPRHPATLRTVRQLAEEQVAGIQLRPGLEPRQTWLNSPQTIPFWEAVRELSLPVCLIMRSHQYNQLSDIVTDFPEITIVLDHLGQGPETRKVVPHYLPVLLEYSRYPQVHVKISKLFQLSRLPHPHEDLWPALEELRDHFGARRLMWGSDYPTVLRYCGYQTEAGLIDALPFLRPAEREWIKYKTARSVWM